MTKISPPTDWHEEVGHIGKVSRGTYHVKLLAVHESVPNMRVTMGGMFGFTKDEALSNARWAASALNLCARLEIDYRKIGLGPLDFRFDDDLREVVRLAAMNGRITAAVERLATLVGIKL